VPLADLDLHEQKESYRHVEEMSQRFLRLILATLALGFVFARPSWVDYMTSASPPSPGLRAVRENGGYIGQLSPSIVLNNGNILRSLVILSLVSLVIATMLAGLVIFLAKPSEEFRGEYETALAYLLLRRKAKRLLRRAYIAAFIGVLLLVSAGVGFWTFYVNGGISILLYDLAVVVVGPIGMIAFSLQFLDGWKNCRVE